MLELSDGLVLAHYLRASCHAENKDYKQALADLNEVLEKEPHHEKALELKARCTLHLE